MANNNIFKGLKEIIYAMYDNRGVERITYFAPISKIDLSEARLTLLRNLCDLVLNTDIISEWSKMYIKDKNITLRSLTDEINRINEEKKQLVKTKVGNETVYAIGGEVSSNTVRSKIEYEQKKLTLALGSKDIIVDILYYPSRSIEEYQIRVANLLSEYRGGANLRDNLNLKFDNKVYTKTYNGNFMDKYENILYTYLESTRKSIEDELSKDSDFVGYFNYLLSGIHTDDKKVLADRRSLIELLSGERYASILDKKELEIEETKRETGTETELVDKNEEHEKLAEDINTVDEDDEIIDFGTTESNVDTASSLLNKYSLVSSSEEDTNTDIIEEYEEEENSDFEFIPDEAPEIIESTTDIFDEDEINEEHKENKENKEDKEKDTAIKVNISARATKVQF